MQLFSGMILMARVEQIFSHQSIERKAGGMNSIEISSAYIKLDSSLKAANLSGSGGEAKIMVTEGRVMVNGVTETRRGRKLYPGDRVSFGKHEYIVCQSL